MKKEVLSGVLVVCVIAGMSVPCLQAEDDPARALTKSNNPLLEEFPYGAYIGNSTNPYHDPTLNGDPQRTREAILRVCKDLSEHNMNAAWANNMSEAVLPYWLEAGKKHGVRIVIQFGGPPLFVRRSDYKNKDDMLGKVGPLYEKLTTRTKDSEALLAYSLTEEERPVTWLYDGLGELIQRIEQWDPKHPAIVMDNKLSSLSMNAKLAKPKAMVMDVYAFWNDGANGPATPLATRSFWTRQCRRARQAADSVGAPFWMIGQGHEDAAGNGQPILGSRRMTGAETRWQFWSAIQEGVKGFFYYLYCMNPKSLHGGHYGLRYGPNEETEQYRVAAELGHSLKLLAPLLLRIDVAPYDQDVVYWENTPVSAQTHIDFETGQRFMSVVNNDIENVQRVGIEMAIYPLMVTPEERMYDLRSKRMFDYHSIKWMTLQPGEGTIFFVGTPETWEVFSKTFYVTD